MKPDFAIEEKYAPETVPFTSLKVGELGAIEEGHLKGTYILRTYSGGVNLADPQKTWGNSCSLHVRKVKNATVTLTFGEGA